MEGSAATSSPDESRQTGLSLSPSRRKGGRKRQAIDLDVSSPQDAELTNKAKKAKKSKSSKAFSAEEVSAEFETANESFASLRVDGLDNQNVPTSSGNFKLTPLAEKLLQDLDDVEDDTKDLDVQDLGRAVRLSSNLKICLSDTIKSCLDVAEDRAYLNLEPLQIVRRCNRIIQITTETANMATAFPFQKLPTEVRHTIYQLVLGQKTSVVSHACEHHKPIENEKLARDRYFHNILLTCRQLYQEALPVYYQINTFEFLCTCALSHFFDVCHINSLPNIKSVKFGWDGDNRISGIGGLLKLSNLDELAVTVQHTTSSQLTEREEEVRKFFDYTNGHKLVRVTESCGFEQLIQLRGLSSVVVYQDRAVHRNHRKKHEVEELQKLLDAKLLLPRTPMGLE